MKSKTKGTLCTRISATFLISAVTAFLALATSSCGRDYVRQELIRTKLLVEKARHMGAKDCAPSELAQAESSVKLSEHDLEKSTPANAERNQVNAERMAKRAIAKCQSKPAAAAPPKKAFTPSEPEQQADAKQAEPQKTPEVRKRGILAVFDIHDASQGFKKTTLDQLTEYLAGQLTQKGYQVVPRSQIRERLLTEAKDSYKHCYDQSCQIELGRALAAKMSLDTKLLKIGDKCVISSTLFDLKQQTGIKAAQAKIGCSENELMGGIERVAEELAGPQTN